MNNTEKEMKPEEKEANSHGELICQYMDECEEDDDGFQLENLCNDLSEYLDKVSKYGVFYVSVKNFGWQSKSGHKAFKAIDATKFLQEILPDTDCHFRIYYNENHNQINIQNFHHDSPCGNEWYKVTEGFECDSCRDIYTFNEQVNYMGGAYCKECAKEEEIKSLACREMNYSI